MYKVASFFSGVGGIDLGFQQTGCCETVYANEFDAYAAETFEKNFPIKIDVRDINDVKAEEIPDADILVGGFPCQAFSIAGLQQGFDDAKGRGNLFFELVRILKYKQPKAALFENVKNLASHDSGATISIILNELLKIGYYSGYRIFNAKDYGNIPQNRERIYIRPVPLTTRIKDVIDFRSRVDERYYYRKEKFQGDIYDALQLAMLHDDIKSPGIYQWRRWYVRKNKSDLIPTLTANQGSGGHNVCIVKTYYGIRKMTPRECFNAQGTGVPF